MTRNKSGFTLLISMLIVGTISLTIAVVLLITGVDYGRSSVDDISASRAYFQAQTCGEIGLQKLRDNNAYAGNETFPSANGSCTILPIAGSGPTNRVIQTIGTSDDSVTRMEIQIANLSPLVVLTSWQEVTEF